MPPLWHHHKVRGNDEWSVQSGDGVLGRCGFAPDWAAIGGGSGGGVADAASETVEGISGYAPSQWRILGCTPGPREAGGRKMRTTIVFEEGGTDSEAHWNREEGMLENVMTQFEHLLTLIEEIRFDELKEGEEQEGFLLAVELLDEAYFYLNAMALAKEGK